MVQHASIAAVTGAATAVSVAKAASCVAFLARISIVVAIAVSPWNLGSFAQAWMLTPSYLTPSYRLGSHTRIDIRRHSVMQLPSLHKSSVKGRGDVSAAGTTNSHLSMTSESSASNDEIEALIDDEETLPTDEKGRPFLKESAIAAIFFGNRAFFVDRPMAQAEAKPMLVKRFGKKTVREALMEFQTEEDAADCFFVTASINMAWIRAYFKSLQSVEDVLAGLGIIALCGGDEIKVIDNRYHELELCDDLLRDLRNETQTRSLPVCMVLGSSGSGKTFFAVKDAATAGVVARQKVTLYLVTNLASSKFLKDFDEPEELVNWIKKRLARDHGYSKQLDMHVSVVVDEAGSPGLKGYFEDRTKLERMCSALGELATSIRLVVSGTGLEGRELCSKTDVYKVRMQPWSSRELRTVLSRRLGMKDSNADVAVHAIVHQPILKALSTNGRSAYFLLQKVADEFAYQPNPSGWVDVLRELAPGIVGFVIRQYVSDNFLSNLRRAERYCLAASLLLAFDNEGKSRSLEIPKFPELRSYERYYASCLIDLNVELVDGTTQYISPNVERTFLVSPAIVVVMYEMLGVQASSLVNLDTQQLITALVEFRTQAIDFYRRLIEASIKKQDATLSEILARSYYDLAFRNKHANVPWHVNELHIVRLFKAVPAPGATKRIEVPRLGKNVIWINRKWAPFAHIIARYTLYHCIFTRPGETVVVNLPEELEKCGLLKSDTGSPGRIALQALLQLWDWDEKDWDRHDELIEQRIEAANKAAPIQSLDESQQAYAKQLLDAKHRSTAFPTNLLDTNCSFEEATFDHFSKSADGKTWIMNGEVALGDLHLKDPLRFVISTNADDILVSLGEGEPIPITVLEDGKVDMAELTPEEVQRYGRFLNEMVDGVEVEFLLT